MSASPGKARRARQPAGDQLARIKAQEWACDRAARELEQAKKGLTHARADLEHQIDALRAMIRGGRA